MLTNYNHRTTMDIKYVMAAPGTGKTKSAIAMMLEHIRAGASGEDVGAIFYVAPSIQLLNQTLKYIRLHLQHDGDMYLMQYVQKIVGDAYDRGVADRAAAKLDSLASGQVFFLTHDGFLLLRRHAAFQDTTVIFDESRNWVAPVKKIRFKDTTRELFNTLFRVKPSASGVCKVVARKLRSTRDSIKAIHSTVDGEEFAALYNFHKHISADPSTGYARVEAYGALAHDSGDTYTMVRVEIPSRPFDGFREVYILSAMFEVSQMYYLLLHDRDVLKADITILNYTDEFFDKYGGAGWRSEVLKIRSRYSRVVIVPLLTNDDRVLTVTSLDRGVVSKPIDYGKRQEYRPAIHELRTIEKNGIPHDIDICRAHKITTRVLGWMLEATDEVLGRWLTKYPSKSKPLVFTNYEEHKQEYDDSMLCDSTEWSGHAKAKGSNAFIGSNAVAYLAAVNADPLVIRVLRHRVGRYGYDPNQDYVVSSALQCIGRGNVRNHDSTEPMLAIVPTVQLANYLKAGLGNLPKVDTSFAKAKNRVLYPFSAFNGGNRVASEVSVNLTDNEKSRLASIRALKSRYKKKGDMEKVKAYEQEYQAIMARVAKRIE